MLNYWAIFGILLFVIPYWVICHWLGRFAVLSVAALAAKKIDVSKMMGGKTNAKKN